FERFDGAGGVTEMVVRQSTYELCGGVLVSRGISETVERLLCAAPVDQATCLDESVGRGRMLLPAEIRRTGETPQHRPRERGRSDPRRAEPVSGPVAFPSLHEA